MQAAPSCYGSMVASTSEEVTTSLSKGPMTILEDSHKGFVIIIDRRSDKWSSVRTLLLQISSFFPGKICVTFVIKPEGVLQRALEVGYRGAADTCTFKVIQLESSAELRKYIHHEHLTMDVGGLIKYNHLEWVQHRMVSLMMQVLLNDTAYPSHAFFLYEKGGKGRRKKTKKEKRCIRSPAAR
ncbi:hypothetical protein CRE_07543 [Caenorhabditis remanei]|uniref:CRAL-TRIO domain-containing protein n=1 Tax=Caenorhabditis remanei TaxID=31234 RepID=E3M2D5_CAERE|nr:hypothetical protein CRE_07543 [Caenorhabditis remanei]